MRRVIVIGASGFVGRAVCEELARRDAKVAGTYFRNPTPLAGARSLDLLDAGAIKPTIHALSAELGGADALCVCAAEAVWQGVGDVSAERLARMLAVNVTGAFLCAKAFAELPSSTKRSITFVGSIDGAKSVPTSVAYATSKGALVAMARALAKELAPSVLVNVVAPGLLDGGISTMVPEEVKREYLKHSALKRFGTRDEVARTLAWFLLANTYVTGQTIVLDGGL
jgi:3-oxoacyl-[acyl-carrier protein] reductase